MLRKSQTIRHHLKQKILDFGHDESGSVAVWLTILLPVFLWLIAFFETQMQAQYVYQQAQTVMDLATRAGATTGEAIQSGSNVFCTIPYRPSDPEYSGYHTALKVLKENSSTLPEDTRQQILDQCLIGIPDLNDPDLRASGYVEMKLDLTYNPNIPLLFHDYRFSMSSSSKCQAVPTT